MGVFGQGCKWTFNTSTGSSVKIQPPFGHKSYVLLRINQCTDYPSWHNFVQL